MKSYRKMSHAVRRRRRAVASGVLGVTLLGFGAAGMPAGAASGSFPRNFNPEPGLHTFTPDDLTNPASPKPAALTPACPEALAGTPGSDPAEKTFNKALNTAASFQPGGTVHYIYDDNAHTNGGTANFTVQDCLVAYAPGTFTAADFDQNGLLVNTKKSALKGGTQLDGASMSGISNPAGDPIYFSWTSPTTATTALEPGTWVCNFARDIKNNHSGGGNRKVAPLCYQLGSRGPGTQVGPGPTIYAGYADDFVDINGARGAFTPTPWKGPGVVFAGCNVGAPDCGTYDAGAIRIDNNYLAGGTLTLTGATVTIGACVFNQWGAYLPATAAEGQKIILTQTGTNGPPQPAACAQDISPQSLKFLTNFDTSEPPGPAHNCDPANGLVPVIHLTFADGTDLTINDTAKVLNTGGIDLASCPQGTDEGRQWVAIG